MTGSPYCAAEIDRTWYINYTLIKSKKGLPPHSPGWAAPGWTLEVWSTSALSWVWTPPPALPPPPPSSCLWPCLVTMCVPHIPWQDPTVTSEHRGPGPGSSQPLVPPPPTTTLTACPPSVLLRHVRFLSQRATGIRPTSSPRIFLGLRSWLVGTPQNRAAQTVGDLPQSWVSPLFWTIF